MTNHGAPPSRGLSTAKGGTPVFAEFCLRRLPEGTILNIGAGFTDLTSPTQRVVNLDLDALLLAQVGSGVAGDVHQLPFAERTFEGALMKDVLEHLNDPIDALREVARTCKVNAVLTVTVPRAIPRAVWADPTHVRGFTQGALRQALELGGWTTVGRIDRVGSLPGAGHSEFLLRNAPHILRIPGIGHWLGLNWMATARLAPTEGSLGGR
jgi:SAM-dependent methyltransferase